MFFINHTDIGDGYAAIIEIDGPLNGDSAPDFDDYIQKLTANNIIYLLIDMKNLNFISSEGIGATLMIQKSINEKNGLALFFNLNYEITSLFKLLGFDKVFTIAEDRADALHMLDRHMELYPEELSRQKSEAVEFSDEIFPEEEKFATGSIEPEPVIPPQPDENSTAFEPFIIECVKCRSLIRVKESGDQLCPYCSAEFTVTDNKQAVFKVRDIHP